VILLGKREESKSANPEEVFDDPHPDQVYEENA